jgi:hypothetical protein
MTATELSKVWEIAEMFGHLSLHEYRVKSEAKRGLICLLIKLRESSSEVGL